MARILTDDERRQIRLRVQIEHMAKHLNIDPDARIKAQRLLTKEALSAARSAVAGMPLVKRLQARGAHVAVGVGMANRKQLAGTVTTGEQTFSGYLSTWDEDLGGDVCQPGCFDATLANLRTLQQRTNARFLLPLLWGHDPSKPIGGVSSAVPDATGLFITAMVDTTTAIGAEAWSALSHGYGVGLSIGYSAQKTTYDNAGRRLLLVVNLVEASVTPIPMNQLAVVTRLN